MNPQQFCIDAAIKQLRRSERGRQALKDLLAMIDNGADGLDCWNQDALLTLFEAAVIDKQTSIVKDLLGK